MVDPVIIAEWLAKAENDFEFAQIVFAEEKEYFDQICFHYPMDWPVETTKDKAQRAQDSAARIRELVRSRIPA